MKQNQTRPTRRPQKSPDFTSGILAEPLLSFGGQHRHVDPKTGLSLYGPYTLVGQTSPTLRNIVVGIVGPASMTADAMLWLEACRGVLTNDGSQPFWLPHFPGINKDRPFECELTFGEAWREVIGRTELNDALAEHEFERRIYRIAELYTRGLQVLAGRDPQPEVVLCCIPDAVIDTCTVRPKGRARLPKAQISRGERRALDALKRGQGFLFREMQPSLGTEDEEPGHQNLRRAIKALAMPYGLPTQLVWPKTLVPHQVERMPGEVGVQDVATRAWNFITGLYHKAGGTLWRLADLEPDTCYIGVSFYRELGSDNSRMRTSMAQAFTAAGDGYVLRGSSFEWNEASDGRSPHLTRSLASSLMRDVLELYKSQNRDSLPSRVVVHKTSRFWEEELSGFQDAAALIPRSDFLAIGSRGFQFYRTGEYPALRGTYVKFGEGDLLLYTSGYIPFLRTYPGARVPQPLDILEHHGDSPWDRVLSEVLALTKMNWNTADFSGRDPITIAFSRRVGQILAEVPEGQRIRSEYRYYM